MSEQKVIKLNKSKDNTYSVICQTCKVKTKHKVITSANEEGKAPMDYNEWYYWNNDYEIIQCLGCETISFRLEHSNSEDYDYENDMSLVDETIYPRRNKDTWDIKSFYNVPVNLRRIYRETIDCYNNDSFTLCGSGVRSIVEGLCKENGITEGDVEITKKDGSKDVEKKNNLQGKINGLHQKGKLTKENAEILHEHRFLGNLAVHELDTPSKEELKLALEIIENVFDTLYEIPNKASLLKYKRIQKENKLNRFYYKHIYIKLQKGFCVTIQNFS